MTHQEKRTSRPALDLAGSNSSLTGTQQMIVEDSDYRAKG